MVLLGPGLLACAGAPEPRPPHLDPSNPDAPTAERIELEAFASGPRGLDDPLLPEAPVVEEDHDHDHGEAAPPGGGHEERP